MTCNNENFKCLLNGLYLVRTQAGFKQALRHFAGEQDLNRLSPYPTVYPAIVLLKQEYSGYHSTYCTWWSVRIWREYVATIEKTICESDMAHKNMSKELISNENTCSTITCYTKG